MLRAACIAAITALCALTTLALPAAPASATVIQSGKVIFVADGDTVDVNLTGVGTRRIRMIGVQATELHVYSSYLNRISGECWAAEATRRLSRLVAGKPVRVSSRATSSLSGSRLHRSVAVSINGVWRDTGQIMLDEGLVLPDVNGTEYDRNRDYSARAQRAATARRGMWGSSAHCGSGPAQTARLSVAVNWDAPGNDMENVNGEYVRITNRGTSAVSLAGWRVRDNAYRGTYARGYVFPRGTRVAAGDSVYVHPGRGASTGRHFYWGLSAAIFENATGAPTYKGDGAYLFDPHGDLRGWRMYPCRYAC
jgi:endonuclease YncB( thermonuclease family)